MPARSELPWQDRALIGAGFIIGSIGLSACDQLKPPVQEVFPTISPPTEASPTQVITLLPVTNTPNIELTQETVFECREEDKFKDCLNQPPGTLVQIEKPIIHTVVSMSWSEGDKMYFAIVKDESRGWVVIENANEIFTILEGDGLLGNQILPLLVYPGTQDIRQPKLEFESLTVESSRTTVFASSTGFGFSGEHYDTPKVSHFNCGEVASEGSNPFGFVESPEELVCNTLEAIAEVIGE